VSALSVAAVAIEPLVMSFGGNSRAGLPVVRDGVEYLCDSWTMSRVRPSMVVDLVFALPSVVTAR
jgi:hypothetical protein